MFVLADSAKVYLYAIPIDLRKSIDGLVQSIVGILILPRFNGHSAKRPLVLQNVPGLNSQASNEDVFYCNTHRYNQTHDFLRSRA